MNKRVCNDEACECDAPRQKLNRIKFSRADVYYMGASILLTIALGLIIL